MDELEEKGRAPRVLLFDIECTPMIGYTWGKWQQNVIQFVEDWHILSFAYAWYEEGKPPTEEDVRVVALPDFPDAYDADPKNDFYVVRYLHALQTLADVVVAHNGDQFDIPKVNARYAVHGLNRPTPHYTVDTKKVAARQFKFASNSLNDLGQFLNLGEKAETGGFDLWLGCMAGDPAAWETMIEYNRQDVVLLGSLYHELKYGGWIANHPPLNTLVEAPGEVCPTCLSSEMHRRGMRATRAGVFQQWHCLTCGSYSRSRKSSFRRPESLAAVT